ncbi:rap guanine nucleotide exchange factor 6 isoform X4 [Aethina tumida]|uniref:rap guanine nucleotide exchange factor 6 isoform X4 n=1 Tax=Aethina tumida TaxID=116153 RepID=UPI0021498CF5|nr:rap guanine nucleotide exchange factor 6 isoform X4 [Aethina tumida]
MVSPSRGASATDWEEMWLRSLSKPPTCRSLQDLQVIYYGLSGLEALQTLRDSHIRTLCKMVRYEKRQANDVLYYTGELSTCWYILLSGSVFIDGSMFLPRSSFGKRTGGSARRQNECFVLEPSEMIVIDYPEIDQNRRIQNSPLMDHSQHRPMTIMFDDAQYMQSNLSRPSLYHKYSRGSHSSDTSSAYSGSDTMASNHSELDAEELDLTGLVESVVDSDEEDDLAESMDSLTVRDRVRDCLEKEPTERTEDDIETLLEFTQHLKAFTNMTLAVRRALCAVMVFAVVEKANTTVMHDGEELDSWSVLVNGTVEVHIQGEENQVLTMGDAFGILPTMEKLYHKGVMITKCDDCQFVCITQTDYYRILHQGEENTRKHEEDGKLVMVTELRGSLETTTNRRGHVVIRATPQRLMTQLIEENSLTDPTYVEDFLLTHRTFIPSPLHVANQLLDWFRDPDIRDRVTRVVLLWVNNHFTDFETDPDMIEFLETFELGLENEKMVGQLRLLNIACAAKARIRNVILARPNRDEPLNFQILGGFERNFGIFISKVDKKSKAEEVGLKRGDQIIEVNGQSFEHVSHTKALEILRGATHLSIAVKSNLLNFKEMLNTPDNSPRPRGRKPSDITKLPPDSRMRISSVDGNVALATEAPASQPVTIASPQKESKKMFMTLGPKRRIQKALINMRMNFLTKNIINVGMGSDQVDSAPPPSNLANNIYQSQSNPDLMSICYDDVRCADYPEHVLKVYKPDQTYKYLLVNKETTAHEVVMLALQEFGMTDPSSNYSLCEVSVTDTLTTKQKRLPDQLQNLAERIGLSSRYYLKTNGITETLVPDELAPELVRESDVHFLQLNAVEVAIQLTLQDFSIFRQIEPTEYIDDLFELKSKYGTPMLEQFAALVNREMFWVVSEVCAEHNPVRRMKIIKQFIKVARQCKECKNFNSMFAIVSGLGHRAVSRLRQSWDKLPGKYQRVFNELQQLMDPSRNMSKYRQLISAEQTQPPIIPFYPVVKKDLTFIHLGNDCTVEGLVNFEKLRMIAKEVRSLSNMCSSPYDLLTMLELGGQPASNAMVALNQLTTASSQYHAQGQTTVKRRKKSTAAPNPKRMFEESQMVRRVKAYLNNLQVETDEARLDEMSLECEGAAPSSSSSVPGSQRSKRHASPAPSTTSSTSSASDERKPTQKFGSASPQAVKKLLALSEPNKTRPHQPRAPPGHGMANQPSPNVRRAPSATGSVTSSDSGHSTISQVTTSSVDGHAYQPGRCSSPTRHPPPILGWYPRTGAMPPCPQAVAVLPPLPHALRNAPSRRQPPTYSVAAQMAKLQRLGRAHSHEGVTQGYHYHNDPDTDQGDDLHDCPCDSDTVIIMV